jgi:peptidyl-prolyl cis-trans isomerase C
LKKRYDELSGGYKPHEEIHAHHVLLETEDQAKAVIADLRAGGVFEDVAKAKSKDPSAAQNGGDLGFFAKEQMVPEFSDAATALKVGEVTAQPVKTQFGWHVIRLDEKRMSSVPPFAEAKEDIRRMYIQQSVQDSAKALRAKAKIDVKVTDAPPPAK